WRRAARDFHSQLFAGIVRGAPMLDPARQLPEQFNAAEFFVDRHLAEGRAEKIAIEYGERRVTYAELFEKVNQTGNALRGLGVRAEERVLLVLLDCPEFAFCF